MDQLDSFLETYLVKKAPFQIPAKWRENLVKWMPWIVLLVLILAMPAILALFGLSLFIAPFAYLGGLGYGFNYSVAIIVLAATLVLEGLAIPGLFKRQKSAWRLLYYSALLNALYNLISFNIGGAILGTVISLYLLFQVRELYH